MGVLRAYGQEFSIAGGVLSLFKEGATDGQVLTFDSTTGRALFKDAGGGSGDDPNAIHADGSRPLTDNWSTGSYKISGASAFEGSAAAPTVLKSQTGKPVAIQIGSTEALHVATDLSLVLNTSRISGGAAGSIVLAGSGMGVFYDDGSARVNLVSGSGPLTYGDTGYAIIVQGNSLTLTTGNALLLNGSRVVGQIGGFEKFRLANDGTFCVGTAVAGNAGGVQIVNDAQYAQTDSSNVSHSLLKLTALGSFNVGEAALPSNHLGGITVPTAKAITGAGTLAIDAATSITLGATTGAIAVGSGGVPATFNGGVKCDTGTKYQVKTGTLQVDAPASQNIDLSVNNVVVTRVAPLSTRLLKGLSVNRTPIADAAYTALESDIVIAYTSLTATRLVTGPVAPSPGQVLIIKDESGNASAIIKINFTPTSGNVDGSAGPFAAVSSARGVARFYFDGTNWNTW